MAKKTKRRKSSSLSRAIGVTGKCFMRYEMKKRCGIGRRRPAKKNVIVIPPEISELSAKSARCWMWYNVDICSAEEYDFMVKNGIKIDFENERYTVNLQNIERNKQILNAFRIEVAEKNRKNRKKMIAITLAKWSTITVLGMATILWFMGLKY